MKCLECGTEQPEGAAFCDNCGAALGQMQQGSSPPEPPAITPSQPNMPEVAQEMIICPDCQASVVPGARFCDNCGFGLTSPQSPPTSSASGIPAPAATPPEVVSVPPEPDIPATGQRLCPACGVQMPSDAMFCDNCGERLSVASPAVAADQHPEAADLEDASVCMQCGTHLEAGSNFCDNCGAPVQGPLPQQGSPSSDSLPFTQEGTLFASSEYTPPASHHDFSSSPGAHTQVMPQGSGSAYAMPEEISQSYAPPVPARLVIQASNLPLPFPAGKNVWIIGREDPANGIFPDIDLTDYGGDELGVSREHAKIYRQDTQFYIDDLQSTNHTYVNQKQIQPGQALKLNPGDELRVGSLKLYFQLV